MARSPSCDWINTWGYCFTTALLCYSNFIDFGLRFAPVVLVGVFWLAFVISNWLATWLWLCGYSPISILLLLELLLLSWEINCLLGGFVEILGGQSFAFAGWIELRYLRPWPRTSITSVSVHHSRLPFRHSWGKFRCPLRFNCFNPSIEDNVGSRCGGDSYTSSLFLVCYLSTSRSFFFFFLVIGS